MGGKIIFVNSFKGGAGKTTLSLMHCITNLFAANETGEGNGTYDNVIYMDLDLLGTATSYLFDEEKMPKKLSFHHSGKAVSIPITIEDVTKELYVTYLDPGFKNRDFSGEEYFIHHKALDEEILRQKTLGFLSRNLANPSTLVVLDCAPGFSELEQTLLLECYQNALKWGVDIEENYVMTLDAAHIHKSIFCLKGSEKSLAMGPEKRKLRLVFNDIQNFADCAQDEDGFSMEQFWQDMVREVGTKLPGFQADFYYWKYSRRIAARNTFLREEKVENQAWDYIMSEDSFRLIGKTGGKA